MQVARGALILLALARAPPGRALMALAEMGPMVAEAEAAEQIIPHLGLKARAAPGAQAI